VYFGQAVCYTHTFVEWVPDLFELKVYSTYSVTKCISDANN
jgi:hypothetical protein